MNRKLLGVIGLCVLLVSGCERKNIYDPSSGAGKVTLENYYDFRTTQVVQLDLEYVGGDQVYFELYGENPLKSEEGMMVKKEELIALAKGITDENGKYSLKATLPASMEEVYIYSPDFGAPRLFKSTVSGYSIRAKIDFEAAVDLDGLSTPQGRSSVNTRIAWNAIAKHIPNRLSEWNASGVPALLHAEPAIRVDGLMKKYINAYLPEGGGKNKPYLPYVTDNADITLYEEASKVCLSYLGGETSARSVFAYYCYPKNATVEEIREAAKHACVIFPNAHKSALGINSGVTMALRYIDPAGNVTDGNFPKDTRIGFLLWNNGWTGKPFNNSQVFYSTKTLNTKNLSFTAMLGIKDKDGKEYNVIGFEDWPNNVLDYNDVLFVISSDPAEAIVVPPAPEPEDKVYTETYQGLLGFEDCWPDMGDYDMNDVVIKYFSNITCNSKNEIISSIDKFTLTWTGANFHNAFAYELPYKMDNKVVKFTGKGDIKGNIITLFNNAKGELGVENIIAQDMPAARPEEVSYTITTNFDVSLPKEGIVPPYNPFIRIKNTNTEVHLTNYRPTKEAGNIFPTNAADISDGETTWFVCEDGFPFAIHMDARMDQSLMQLNLKPEAVRIDKTYPGFAEWAKNRDPKIKWW